ncbi:MAG: hypothetical protein HY717_07285 [Planctomycetes bacterium]|nr:hypothetical protein [Planctomycetota bacterium]
MLDIDIEEKLIKKVGGKFKLTTLIQKRMVELHRPGAKSLIKIEGDRRDLRRIVVEEILQEKIQLAPREEVGYSLEEEKELLEKQKITTSQEEEPPSPEIYGSDIKKIKEQRIKELAQLLNPKKA